MNRPLALRRLAALLSVTLSFYGGALASETGSEIRIEKVFITVPGATLRPLYIHDPAIRSQVTRLIEKERKLTELESVLLADLSGGLDTLTRGSESGQEASWLEQTLFYRGIAGLSGLAGSAMGYLEGAPSMASLFHFCAEVSRAIDETASKRRALEAAYIDRLCGPPVPSGSGPGGESLITMPEQERAAVIVRLRERLLDMRKHRQNTLENLLLAMRWADASGLPTATLERSVDWLTTDQTQIDRLKQRLSGLNLKRASVQGAVETNDALLRHQRDSVAVAEKIKDEAQKAIRLAHLEERRLKLERDRAAYLAALEKTKTEIKEVSDAIEKAQAGIETEAKEPSVRRESGKREAFGAVASTVSPGYAELAIRRRIHRRATREAKHVFELVDKLASGRRMVELASPMAAYLGKDEPQAASPFATGLGLIGGAGAAQAPAPRPRQGATALRAAYIDQGLASIAKRELQTEDSFEGQTAYFTALSQFMNEGEGRLDSDDWSTNIANFGADLGHGTLHLFTGMTFAFFDQCRVAVNAVSPIHITTQLDKAHKDLRKARLGTDKQIEFLIDALRIEDSGLRAYLGLESEPAPRPFVFEKPALVGSETALELFKEDKAFFDALDGGLRRIGSSLDATLEERLATEYVIHYEKACFTLRDLIRMENVVRGLDEKSGEFSFKLFLSPIRAILAAGRFAYQRLDPLYGPRDLEISAWIQRRTTQVQLMEQIFPLLKKCGFELREVYRRKDEARTFFDVHWELWRDHPDYRRFWHKCERERLSEEQKQLLDAESKAKSWWEKEMAEERLEVIAASAPSQRTLARAHMQDAFDFMQLYNYGSALSSLIDANELDPALVSSDTVLNAERVMAGWQASERAGTMLSQIGDQVIWQMITQGIVARLKVGLGFEVQPKAWAQTLGEAMTAIKGQFNPLISYITSESILQNGIALALAQAATKVASQLAQEAVRDEVLINRMHMDPEVADRIAGLFWSVAEDLVRDSIKETSVFKRASIYFYARRVVELERQAGPVQDLATVLADNNAPWLTRWRARRRMTILLTAAKLQEHINKLREELGEAQAAKKPIAPAKVTELEDAENQLARQRKTLSVEEVSRLFAEHNLDVLLSPHMLESTDPAKRKEAMEAALKLLDLFDGRITELAKLLGNEALWGLRGMGRRKQLLEAFDMARRTLHVETFDQLAALKDPALAAKLLEAADAMFEAAKQKAAAKGKPGPAGKRPSESLDLAGIQRLMKMIVAIVPTGSAGYMDVEGGEYRKATSDMDYTIVLQSPDGGTVDPSMRVAFEFLVQASFQKSSGGRKMEDFDMSIMVDDRLKFTGSGLELQGPHRILSTVRNAKPGELAAHIKALDDAVRGIVTDAPHGERYLSMARIMALTWLTCLGQDIMVFENGKLVKRKKADLINTAQGELLHLLKNTNARLEPWMMLGIVVDDAGFLGKKLSELAERVANSPGDKEPLAAYVKELNKRSIRIMLGFILSDPEGLRRLNELPERALRGEIDPETGKPKVFDHSTICDIALDVLKRGPVDMDAIVRRQLNKGPNDPLPPPDSPEYKLAFTDAIVRRQLRIGPNDPLPPRDSPEYENAFKEYQRNRSHVQELIETSRDVKKGTADVDEIVRRQLKKGPNDPLPAPDSPEYKRAFDTYVRNTKRVINVMTAQAVEAGARELKPLFQEREALNKQIAAPEFQKLTKPEQNALLDRKHAIDAAIDVQILPLAAWHKNVGAHIEGTASGAENPLQQAVRTALGEAGAAPDELDRAIRRVQGEPQGGEQQRPGTQQDPSKPRIRLQGTNTLFKTISLNRGGTGAPFTEERDKDAVHSPPRLLPLDEEEQPMWREAA